MMERDFYQDADTADSKHLMDQLMTSRKEINNLRQQIKNLRYLHEKEVNSIKQLIETSKSSPASNLEPLVTNNIDENALNYRPIGLISTWFPNKRGTPRQPTVCNKVPGKITLFKSAFTNPDHALQGLEEFSHMWILFHFHKNEVGHIRAKVAPPRLNGMRTGVFSTRSPHRPCPIGLSLVKIVKIEDCVIYFEGVDMVDETPVLDIKPYIPNYDNPIHIEKILNSTSSNVSLVEAASTSSTYSTEKLERHKMDEASALPDESRENINTSNDDELAAIASTSTNRNIVASNMPDFSSRSGGDSNSSNLRQLEGADDPKAVRNTDVNVINRGVRNLELNRSSPVRMGVREAPDGEENLDEPQTISTVTSAQVSERQNPNAGEDSVRVPNWIASPEVSTLSVVFNERSILQLRELLRDKADEKKQAVENVLREDPRSVYLRRRYGNQFYTFLIHDLHITCKFNDDRKLVTVLQVRSVGRICDCGQPECQCSGQSPGSGV